MPLKRKNPVKKRDDAKINFKHWLQIFQHSQSGLTKKRKRNTNYEKTVEFT